MALKKGGLTLLGGIGVVGVVAILAYPLVGSSAAAITSNSVTQHHASVTHSVKFDPDTDLVPAEARCVDNTYINSSTQVVKTGDAKYRQFATAVSIPYVGTTDAAVSAETSKEICGSPTELKMVADDMLLWTLPGAEANKPWLQKVVNDLNSNKLDSFIAKKTENGGLIVSETFQKYAGWINTVLLRANTDGEQSLPSVRNWEQPATVDPTTQPVAVLAADQESKPAWVRTFLDKNGKCLYKFGFNAEDKRIETFTCVTPPPPHVGCVVTATHKCTTTHHGCTSNCGGTTCTGIICVCPTHNVIPDCSPKSSNAKDYTYPSGKKPVKETDSADKNPPTVVTTTPGGDSSTDKPGSSTVINAPGATASPSPRPTPPPEGGDN